MRNPDVEAEHVMMALHGASPPFQMQLLRFHHPKTLPNEHLESLREIGFNHLCFAGDDIEARSPVCARRASSSATR